MFMSKGRSAIKEVIDWALIPTDIVLFLCFQILVVQEVKLYTVSNFVADVGGYLGLLLGGSIPSIIESIFDWDIFKKPTKNT